MEKKITIQLTQRELGYLEHILWHFTDYMSGDDRPDHGLGILKHYREMPPQHADKHLIYSMAGKLRRRWRKVRG